MKPHCLLLSAALLAAALPASFSADNSKPDPRYPYRTDFANANLPWYQLKPGEFPPMHADHRVTGELIEADFIHRSGRYREVSTGRLRDFQLLPFGNVVYLNAPADLRDIPLGTDLLFMLFPDEHGAFTRAGTVQDTYTTLAGHSFSYRLDEARLADGKLLVTTQSLPKHQPDLGQSELSVTKETRVWRGDKQIGLSDLAAGDSLLVNLTARDATSRGRCTDIWVGEETHKLVTTAQRAKHDAFLKLRGLPAWIDRVDGPRLTLSLLCWNETTTRKELQALLEADFGVGKILDLAVATNELRTYNPPSDKMHSALIEIKKSSSDGLGNSGVKLIVEPKNLLEGFRQGRIVRIFSGAWKAEDMPWGETLSAYRQHPSPETHDNLPLEYPAQFPYRTDYGNAQLPWYQLQPGVVPPPFSAHCVTGELVQVDKEKRAGQFRMDRTGELVDFTLTPEGAKVERSSQPKAGAPLKIVPGVVSVMYHDTESSLADLPPGTRCRFHLYQDEHAAFTKASLIMDEFTWLSLNQITYRLDSIRLDQGELQGARQIPPPFDYHGDKVAVPDLGRGILPVDEATQVWKNGKPAKLSDLALNDTIIVNFSGEGATTPARCREIWVGPDSQALATETQKQKFAAEEKASPSPKAKAPPRKNGTGS